MMIECTELAGKVVQRCTIDKDASDGPEIHVEFTDGAVFSVSLKSKIAIETKPATERKRMTIVAREGKDA